MFGILLGGLPKLGIPALGLIVAIYAPGLHRQPWPATSSSCKEVRRSWPPSWPIGSYLAFIVLLKLQFPVWPTFITG